MASHSQVISLILASLEKTSEETGFGTVTKHININQALINIEDEVWLITAQKTKLSSLFDKTPDAS